MPLTSFAAIKRRIQPGTRLRCVRNTYRPEFDGQDRTVRKVQTNAIAWTIDGDPRPWPQQPLQWTYWPPARDVTVVDGDTFRLAVRNRPGHHIELRFR